MRACYRTVLLTSLVASVLAVPALAQTSPALTNFPACTVKPTASDSDAAHSAFLLGKRFFDEADYGSAIHNFVDAYKLDCTKTELLTIIARANELSGDRAEAVHALETYLLRVQNLAPEDRAQIQKRIDNLKSQLPAQTSSTTPPPPPPSRQPRLRQPRRRPPFRPRPLRRREVTEQGRGWLRESAAPQSWRAAQSGSSETASSSRRKRPVVAPRALRVPRRSSKETPVTP